MKWSDGRHLWLAALAVAAFAVQVWAFHALSHDDAFIAYRYGRNLALGHGLVFNLEERVLGFTSPLHVLLAAIVHVLVGQAALPHVMAALGCAGWTAQAVATQRLFARAGLGTSLLLAALVAAGGAGSAVWVALETNIAVGVSLWALVAVLRERWTLGAVLGGLACLARPDAALMVLVIAGFAALRARRGLVGGPVLVRAALAFGAVVVPWVVFATLYYGSPVPVPLLVKFHRTPPAEYAAHVVRIATETLVGLAEPEPELVLAAWLAALAGALALVRRETAAVLFFAYGLLECAAYLFLRPFRQHAWHLYPALFVFCVAAWGLAVEAVHWLARFRPAAAAALGVALVAAYAARTQDFARSYASAYWFGARDAVYREAARYLKREIRPGDRVAAVEVGTLGYYSDARFYDLGGLTTRSPVVALVPPRPYDWLAADAKYPYLTLAPRSPVRVFARGGFELRLYVDR